MCSRIGNFSGDLTDSPDARRSSRRGFVSIKGDSAFNRVSDYFWMNIEVDSVRVGKLRLRPIGRKVVVQSIIIFPEFERKGYARETIDHCKEKYDEIIADRVRNPARKFWEKMGFTDNKDGNYVWRRHFRK